MMKNEVLSRWAVLAILFLTAFETKAALPPTQVLDRVQFGVPESEKAHEVKTDRAPVMVGGLGRTARVVQVEGALTLSLACDPERPNLVTLKIWGGDVHQIVKSTTGESLRMEAVEFRVFVDDTQIKEAAVEQLTDTPYLPGRFIYRTVAIPLEHTRGKEELTLTIKPAAKVGGAYATVGGTQATITAPGSYSRGIYAAYSHTENIFVPSEDETLGEVPASGVGTLFIPAPEGHRPDFSAMRGNLTRAIDEAVDELKRRQLFGPEFDAARAELGIPEKLHGLFDWTRLETYIHRGRSQQWEANDPQWLTPVTGSASGRGHSGAGYIYMSAYHNRDSRFYEDEGMVQRTLAALDGYCRYQGANGGLEIGGGEWGWVGGPDRSRATGGLPGYFAGGLASSFLTLYPVLSERPELLGELIDHNGDGQKTVSRQEAYTRLFRDWLLKDYMRLALRTACANQDIHTALAAWQVNQCLQILSPQEVLPKGMLVSGLRHSVGIMPRDPAWVSLVHGHSDNVDTRGGDQLMISPGGITMEWGFAPGYGQMQSDVAEIYRLSQDPQVAEQVERFLSAIQHFIYPWNTEEGFRWVIQSAVGSRNTAIVFYNVNWPGFLYAAQVMGNPIAGRILRLGLAHANDFENYDHGPQDRMHLTSSASMTVRLLEQLPEFEAFWEKTPGDYRLPAERKDFYAWTDPTSSALRLDPVMIKEDARTLLYIQSDRYHLITDRYQSYGTTHLHENNRLVEGRFGPYWIAINRTDTPDIHEEGAPRIWVPSNGLSSAVDVLTDKGVDLTRPAILQPRTAWILDTRRGPGTPESDPAETTFHRATVNPSPNTIFWEWQVSASPAGLEKETPLFLQLPDTQEVRQTLESQVVGGNMFTAFSGGAHLQVMAVNVPARLLAVQGLRLAGNRTTGVQVKSNLPTFRTYRSWDLLNEGGHPPGHRAKFVQIRNDSFLEWRLLDSPEARTDPDAAVQRTYKATSFRFSPEGPVRKIAFDYAGDGGESFPIELLDASGRVLWESQSTVNHPRRVVVEDTRITGALAFRVRVEASHVYAGWFHRIRNLRYE